MKAIGFTRSLPITDPEFLQDFKLPKPEPGGQDLLVQVEAVSVNPVDIKIRRSQASGHPKESPRVLSWDATGVIKAVGSKVRLLHPGDEVF